MSSASNIAKRLGGASLAKARVSCTLFAVTAAKRSRNTDSSAASQPLSTLSSCHRRLLSLRPLLSNHGPIFPWAWTLAWRAVKAVNLASV